MESKTTTLLYFAVEILDIRWGSTGGIPIFSNSLVHQGTSRKSYALIKNYELYSVPDFTNPLGTEKSHNDRIDS